MISICGVSYIYSPLNDIKLRVSWLQSVCMKSEGIAGKPNWSTNDVYFYHATVLEFWI